MVLSWAWDWSWRVLFWYGRCFGSRWAEMFPGLAAAGCAKLEGLRMKKTDSLRKMLPTIAQLNTRTVMRRWSRIEDGNNEEGGRRTGPDAPNYPRTIHPVGG